MEITAGPSTELMTAYFRTMCNTFAYLREWNREAAERNREAAARNQKGLSRHHPTSLALGTNDDEAVLMMLEVEWRKHLRKHNQQAASTAATVLSNMKMKKRPREDAADGSQAATAAASLPPALRLKADVDAPLPSSSSLSVATTTGAGAAAAASVPSPIHALLKSMVPAAAPAPPSQAASHLLTPALGNDNAAATGAPTPSGLADDSAQGLTVLQRWQEQIQQDPLLRTFVAACGKSKPNVALTPVLRPLEVNGGSNGMSARQQLQMDRAEMDRKRPVGTPVTKGDVWVDEEGHAGAAGAGETMIIDGADDPDVDALLLHNRHGRAQDRRHELNIDEVQEGDCWLGSIRVLPRRFVPGSASRLPNAFGPSVLHLSPSTLKDIFHDAVASTPGVEAAIRTGLPAGKDIFVADVMYVHRPNPSGV